MRQEKVLLLLTACVNPRGMVLTELNDPQVRLQQYIDAVKYYYENTKCKICLCNNTGDDFKGCFSYDDRFEYLFFEGNDYDKSLGKGYGEFEIIKYAARNSRLFAKAEFVVKITGRLLFPDMFKSIKWTIKVVRGSADTVITRFSHFAPYAHSECVFAPKGFFAFFVLQENNINDMKGRYFEHFLYDAILLSGFPYLSWVSPIWRIGVSGTANIAYSDDWESKKYWLIDIFSFYRKRSEELRDAAPGLSRQMKHLSIMVHTWYRMKQFFRNHFAVSDIS